jgi:CheY-like chemotaxis protein
MGLLIARPHSINGNYECVDELALYASMLIVTGNQMIKMNNSPVVLVVEDDGLLQLAALELVEAAGLVGLSAANSDEAISILEDRQDIHIVLTDVEMPGSMDGVKLSHFIRNRWPPIHLIIVSGRAMLSESQIPPGTKFFSKPYDDEAIIAQLKKFAATGPNRLLGGLSPH